MPIDLENIKNKLTQKIENSRVTSELHGLSGRFFAGSLFRFALRVLIDVVLICLALYIVDRLISSLFRSWDGCIPCSDCISYNSVIRVGLAALVIFFGSFLSTKFAEGQELVHSACVTAILLFGSSMWIYSTDILFIDSVGLYIGVVLLTYLGYALAIKVGR